MTHREEPICFWVEPEQLERLKSIGRMLYGDGRRLTPDGRRDLANELNVLLHKISDQNLSSADLQRGYLNPDQQHPQGKQP